MFVLNPIADSGQAQCIFRAGRLGVSVAGTSCIPHVYELIESAATLRQDLVQVSQFRSFSISIKGSFSQTWI